MSALPIVSCIVPCFNEKIEVLEESLNSLKNQSFTNFECILVDESTNQETAGACKRFCETDARFLYVHPEKRLGLAGSLNLGIQKARGLLISRFDSDDICHHDRLSRQVDFLEKYPQVSVLGGAIEIIDENGRLIGTRIYPLDHKEIEKGFIFSSAIAHPTVMFRKSVLDGNPFIYDPSFKFSEDLDLWLRLLNQGAKFANLPDPLVQYRQQHTSRNKNHWGFNIKARLRNISRPFVIRKLIGILGIYVWSHLPKDMQQFIFKRIQLRCA